MDTNKDPMRALATEGRVNRAYAERNALAVAFAKAALAAGWNAGRGYDDDPNKDWEPGWRHVVYVDLPGGTQVSWHMSPGDIHLLDGLPTYSGEWDGTFIARNPAWVAALAAQQPAGVDVGLTDEAIERALEARLGLDHTLRQLIRGDTMPVGYSKVEVVRALLRALAAQQQG